MIEPESVEEVARLARLTLPPERREAVARDLDRILEWVARLEAFPTEGIPPYRPAPRDAQDLRDDRVAPSLSPEEVLRNAPDREGDLFRVPPILGEGDDGA